jgi:diguanylate cyclase (GGDEF)-like protein/PAS domain S-box-containing protein
MTVESSPDDRRVNASPRPRPAAGATGGWSWMPTEPQRRLRWRVTLNALLLVVAILVGDLCLPRGFEIGHLYALPILVSVWTGRPRVVLGFAAVCSILTLLGGFSSWRSTPREVEDGLRALGRLLPGGEANPLTTLIWTEIGTAWFVQWVVASLGLLRMELEKALASAGDLTALALEGSPDAVVISDEQRRVTVLNRAAEELLGWSFDEARGRPLSEILDLIVDPRDPREHRGRLRPRHGSERPVEYSSALLADGRGRVVTLRDATRSVAYERHLEDLAFRDRLTGLVNRPALIERLELELAHARRNQSKLAVLFLDLDDFKGVNDTLGHAAGDALLVAAARGLEEVLRETDTVARLGGDEFVVLLPNVRQIEDLERVADKILARLARPISVGGTLRGIRPSIGIALFPDHGSDGAGLLDRADAAMYRAKRDPGRQWVLMPGAHFGLASGSQRRRGTHSSH